jgi:rod shape-determining protein MreC
VKKVNVIKKYSSFFFFFFAILITGLGMTSFSGVVKSPFSYVFSPIYVFASQKGQIVLNWTNALMNASSYIQEYNDMKEEIVSLKVENSEKLIDYEDYKTLKEHISLLEVGCRYVQTNILDLTDNKEIIINKGSDSGIQKGDIVVLGKVFVGIVTDVNPKSSLVRLPLNNASTYEVVVIPSTIDLNQQPTLDTFVKSNGVVLGNVNDIKIENLGINSNVVDGDLVFLKDERVGDLLVLGSLIGVSTNPASTQKSGIVVPIFDYSNILTVYVKVE